MWRVLAGRFIKAAPKISAVLTLQVFVYATRKQQFLESSAQTTKFSARSPQLRITRRLSPGISRDFRSNLATIVHARFRLAFFSLRAEECWGKNGYWLHSLLPSYFLTGNKLYRLIKRFRNFSGEYFSRIPVPRCGPMRDQICYE